MKYEYLTPRPGIVVLLVSLFACHPGAVLADRLAHYRVTIDNLTGQPFSSPVAATHDGDLSMFQVKGAASVKTETMIKDGDQAPMFDVLSNNKQVTEVVDIGVPLAAKEATTFSITARPGNRLSLATMVICNDDGYTGLNRARLPNRGAEIIWAIGYDAGSEDNAWFNIDSADPCSAPTAKSLSGDHARTEPVAKITITHVADDANRFLARLSGAGEVPPVQTNDNPWGQADFTLNVDKTELSYRLKALRIKSGVVEARLHQGLPDDNGPVVAHLFAPEGTDVDERLNTRGQVTQSDLVGPLAGNFDGFVDALRAGELYINVHSHAYPKGEIRGQVGAK